ncbi:MAG: hypothetical protein OJF62_001989 [Pseudolabrys sp.]|jgi:hypothetical protein|nr:hypothetical protein [Pseudolabrys sp.]
MYRVLLPALLLLLAAHNVTHAQVMIDISKVTCQQLLLMRDSQALSYWLSGYYQGEHRNTTLELERFKSNHSKLRAACRLAKNHETPVMQVIDSLK